MKKKVLFLLFSCTLIFMVSSLSVIARENYFTTDELHESLVSAFGESFVNNRMMAQEAIDMLDNATSLDRSGRQMLPDYYAGRFIGEDGKLVISFTNEMPYDGVEGVFSNVVRHNYVRTQSAEFSLNELNTTLALVDNAIMALLQTDNSHVLFERLTGFAIDYMTNRVVIFLRYMSEDAVLLFQDIVLDSPMLEFRKNPLGTPSVSPPSSFVEPLESFESYIVSVENYINKTTQAIIPSSIITIRPGQQIWFVNRSGFIADSASIGYRVRGHWGLGNPGFLTSTHGLFSGYFVAVQDSNENPIYPHFAIIGEVSSIAIERNKPQKTC